MLMCTVLLKITAVRVTVQQHLDMCTANNGTQSLTLAHIRDTLKTLQTVYLTTRSKIDMHIAYGPLIMSEFCFTHKILA